MIQANHSALLVMDVQNGIVQRFAEKPEVMIPFQRAVSAARHVGIPVIFVRVAFRDGYPEVSKKNKMFSVITEHGNMTISVITKNILLFLLTSGILVTECDTNKNNRNSHDGRRSRLEMES